MVKNQYPRQGDIIYIDLEPHFGHEYGGYEPNLGNVQCPMIVLSGSSYNKETGMVSGMVVTSKDFPDAPDFPYQSIINVPSHVKGTIVKWYVPMFDYGARHGRVVGRVSEKELGGLLLDLKNIYDV